MTPYTEQAAVKSLREAEANFRAAPDYPTAERYIQATIRLAQLNIIGKAEYRKTLGSVLAWLS